MMVDRKRNGVLLYIEDEVTRLLFADMLRVLGWDVWSTSDFETAIRQFADIGDRLALVVTDDRTGPVEGRRRGLRGVEFLKQRGIHMDVANVPFVYLMYTGRDWLHHFVSDSGGFVVAMPQTMHWLGELFSRLEREHQLPPKPRARSGEL